MLGFWFSVLGIRGFGFEVSGFRLLCFGFVVFGCWVLGFGFSVFGVLGCGFWKFAWCSLFETNCACQRSDTSICAVLDSAFAFCICHSSRF